MDIYTEKDSDIIYEIAFDIALPRVNYPPYICQYSKGFLIKISLLNNGKPLYDQNPNYEGTKMAWYNYSAVSKKFVEPFSYGADGASLYFLADDKFAELYNEYFPNFPYIIVYKDAKEILNRKFKVIIEMNPIQKGG